MALGVHPVSGSSDQKDDTVPEAKCCDSRAAAEAYSSRVSDMEKTLAAGQTILGLN